MAEQMPKEIEEQLFRFDNPDEIKRIQEKWQEYSQANDNYERNYPEQFAHIVEANNKFKEHKTIPTPAEQWAAYKGSIQQEIEAHLQEQEMQHEETYTLDEKVPAADVEIYMDDPKGDFQLTWDDMNAASHEQPTIGQTHNMDKAQELGITWIMDHEAEQAVKQQKEEKQELQSTKDKLQEFRLSFDKDYDAPEHDTPENSPEMDRDNVEMEHE
jgi:hypothetical protein